MTAVQTPGRSTSPALPQTLRAVSRVVAAICRLPAIPVRDWCDRAAAAVAAIDPGCIAVVVLARLSEDSSIAEIEATGVAAWTQAVGPADKAEQTAPDANLAAPAAFTREVLESIRCSAARMRRLGWNTPTDLGPAGMAGVMSCLGGPTWTNGDLRDLFDPAKGDDLVVGVVPCAPCEQRRCLAVYLGAPRDGFPRNSQAACQWQADVLGASLGLLGRVACAAMGTAGIGKDRWISRREQAVLERLASGKSVRDIARELGRSPHTVHDHLKSLHRKLAAKSRTELLARALGNWPLVMHTPTGGDGQLPREPGSDVPPAGG